MNDKRRRLLLSSQVKVLRSDNPITTCPNCGDDGDYGYDENGDMYSTRSSHIGYCPRCQKYTEYYHCHNFISEDDTGDECNTEWCSVCGYAPHAPTICADCYGNDTFKQASAPPDEHNAADGDYMEGQATLYRCSSCGNEVGWVECDCEGGGDGFDRQCQECGRINQFTSIGGHYCDVCGGVFDFLKCECGTVFCNVCLTRYDEYE